MTNLYIAYIDHLEGKRHNVATEKEVARHNYATEDLGRQNLAETIRHNVVLESQGWAKYNEDVRHNLATETYANRSLAETMRHNTVQESISSTQAQAAMTNAQSSAMQAATSRLLAGYTRDHYLNQDKVSLMQAQNTADSIAVQERQLDLQALSNLNSASNKSIEITQEWDQLYLNKVRTNAEAYKDYAVGTNNWIKSIGEFLQLAQ